jgi:hypothetical protein
MTISSTTRSIEIDAPVEEVLAFIADPYRRMPAQERDYVFLLNGYDEEVPESPDRKNSVVAWDDVNTFTLELSGEPEGTEDGCRYALFCRDGPEGFFLAPRRQQRRVS